MPAPDGGRSGAPLRGLTVERFGLTQSGAKFDLVLSPVERDGLHFDLAYNADVFEPGTMERLLDHLGRLIERLAAQPDHPVAHIPFLAPSETDGSGAATMPRPTQPFVRRDAVWSRQSIPA